MLTASKTRQDYRPVIITVGITLILWLGSKWYVQDWFDNPWKYPAKAASLTATVMMCWCIVLATRARCIEGYFNGLDKVYQIHKRLGKWSFFIILLHPLFLYLDRLPDVAAFLRRLWLLPHEGNRYLLGHNLGIAALILMSCLVGLTLWIKLPYHLWKKSHEWFGLILLVVITHIVAVNRDIAAYPFLAAWMYSLLGLAAVSFVYIRFLYRFLGPRFNYLVDTVERQGDILEITFSPEREKMDFKPSQFVYLVIRKHGITSEPHPYSIACGYNLESRFKLGIKQAGDHTRSLDLLEQGDQVTVYGPYGRFSERFLDAERDCVFIGGGIGITPFLGMWHVALHSEERISAAHGGEKLTRTHPESINTWKSPLVALFYVCVTEDQASFDNDIKHEVILSQFHGFTAFEERGHSYELYLASRQGLISAEYIHHRVKGGVKERNIFLCGPSPMVDALIMQFSELGIGKDQIITEDFNLL